MRPVTRAKQIGCILLVVVGGFAIASTMDSFTRIKNQQAYNPDPPPLPEAKPLPKFDKSQAVQDQRLKVIQDGYQLGLIDRVDVRREFVDLWVTRRFLAQPFEFKKNVVATVYGYYFDGNGLCEVVLKDNISGNDVGQYMLGSGLEMK